MPKAPTQLSAEFTADIINGAAQQLRDRWDVLIEQHGAAARSVSPFKPGDPVKDELRVELQRAAEVTANALRKAEALPDGIAPLAEWGKPDNEHPHLRPVDGHSLPFMLDIVKTVCADRPPRMDRDGIVHALEVLAQRIHAEAMNEQTVETEPDGNGQLGQTAKRIKDFIDQHHHPHRKERGPLASDIENETNIPTATIYNQFYKGQPLHRLGYYNAGGHRGYFPPD